MPDYDEAFLKRLRETFRIEASEHLAALTAGLLDLGNPAARASRAETLESVFREAHSLKGAARAVNARKIELICQQLESTFAGLRDGGGPIEKGLLEQLHTALGGISAELDAMTAAGEASAPSAAQGARETARPERRELPAERPSPDTIRVSKTRLVTLLRQAEDLTIAKTAAYHHSAELREIGATLATLEREWASLRASMRTRERDGSRLVVGSPTESAAERTERTLHNLKTRLTAATRVQDYDSRSLDRRVTDLLDGMKAVTMLPFSTAVAGFPKLVHDLSRDSGKEAQLALSGGEIELDRRVLEEIKDPLIHLVRNCFSHGIETPAERVRAGKDAQATITIAVTPKNGDSVEVVVSDDGAGIDLDKVREVAVRKALVDARSAAELDGRDLAALVFQSGVSTSPLVTSLSGRGLGLAIVREKAVKLGGSVAVETQRGRGASFRLVLPSTLATFQGLLVGLEGRLFVLPCMHLERVLRVRPESIRRAEGREVVDCDGVPVAYAHLAVALGLRTGGASGAGGTTRSAVLLASAHQRMVFEVGEILGVREFVVKGLGRQLRRVKNVGGATILPDGSVAIVLSVPDLIHSGSAAAPGATTTVDRPAPKSVMVVEDSITTRVLLKSILEGAGYRVRTAIDGAEALAALREEPVDLLVSDVDMPRLNGFELTARIRADQALAALPVVLVTALDSRSDRERGVACGANGYIVKSNFEQSNLLEVVQRLI